MDGDVADTADACLRCAAPLRWIDPAWTCGDGCTYCADCSDELGGVCANDSGPLRMVRRTQPVARRRPPAEGLK